MKTLQKIRNWTVEKHLEVLRKTPVIQELFAEKFGVLHQHLPGQQRGNQLRVSLNCGLTNSVVREVFGDSHV